MERRRLIIILSVLVLVLVGIMLGVALLFSGIDTDKTEVSVPDNSQYVLLPAVPADAVMVGCFSNPKEVIPNILSSEGFVSSLNAVYGTPGYEFERMTVSLHHLGSLYPLYVFDLGMMPEITSGDAQSILRLAQDSGLYAECLDCSSLGTERKLRDHLIVLASPAKELVLSSKRHLNASESIMSAASFGHAAQKVSGTNQIFVSNALSNHLVSSIVSGNLRRYSSVLKRFSDWIVLEADDLSDSRVRFEGRLISTSKRPDIISVFDDCGVATSELSGMLPSYTVSAMTLPLKKTAEFKNAYQSYLDAGQRLQRKLILRKSLSDSVKVSPEKYLEQLDVVEVATATFKVEDVLHRVNLLKVRNAKGLKAVEQKMCPFRYGSFIGSVFGDLFLLPDETHCIYVDGWLISGSKEAIERYESGEVFHYTLREYMANAELPDMFNKAASFLAYASFTVEPESLPKMFREDVIPLVASTYEGVDYSGIFLSLGENGKSDRLNIEIFRNELLRSKAPFQARDTTIIVPSGPYPVKNARTGKENYFYQNIKNKYLCLKDENGKGVWGVPFDESICGTAHSIDYLGNGKFQILFGSGSRLHLIDILGRFVPNFSVNLGKDILLGPDLYNADGNLGYYVMVLHKDNTIEMYDLKGKRQQGWSTITSGDRIKSLPERLEVAGKVFWVVRTAVQTLIFPFEGGSPVIEYTGDQMALPDTQITIINDTSIEVESYDGKRRIIRL